MKMIRILSGSAALGKRLHDILYQAGYADITVSDLSAMQGDPQDGILIIYAKSNIPYLMQWAGHCGCRVIMLLNPDTYAMYLDRARHAGITLLLMPVAPYILLDAVQEALAIS